MPRILVLQLKRIGDLILTAPALAGLRSALPDSEIVLVTAAGAVDLARCLPAVNRVVAYAPGRVNMKVWGSALAGPWDVCLDFTGTDRSALLAGLSRARRRIGYAKFSSRPLRRIAFTELCDAPVRELHTLDFHAALIGGVIGKPVAPPPGVSPLVIPGEVIRGARQKLAAAGVSGRYAIMHPGTMRTEKLWRASGWAEVASHAAGALGLSVVLTGADDGVERGHLAELRGLLATPVADMTGALALPELAALIGDCALMLGVDSMATHLAAMFRRPQVAIFGPTNPFHWRPRHGRAAVVMGGGSGPCTVFEPRERPHSMSDVSTAAVIGAIHRVLTDPASPP